MRSYRNLKEIRRKENMGRRLSMIGLAVLFIGLLSSFVPSWYPPDQAVANPIAGFVQQYWPWISFAALPMGFIFASIGSYYINRFARRRWPGSKGIARPDEVLERSMKGFDDKYTFFAWSLPAHYVVVGPCGILLFAVRGDRGRVTVQGDRWREPFSIGRIFTVFAREGVGNPSAELEEQAGKLRTILAAATQNSVAQNGHVTGATSGDQDDGNDQAQLPIEGAAVFLNQQMEINAESPTIPALRVDQVKDYIRRKARDVRLNTARVRQLTDILVENSHHQSDQEK